MDINRQIMEQIKGQQTLELNISALFGNNTKMVVSTFDKVDANALFAVVQQVLENTIILAEKNFKPGNQQRVVQKESVRFSNVDHCRLSLLKKIACKVECSEDHANAYNSLLDMLSKYSFAEKAVLTLAALAMEYGDLIFYVDSRENDRFTSSLSFLRKLDVLVKQRGDPKVQKAFDDLNRLTILFMEMIEQILKFEKLPNLASVEIVQAKNFANEHSKTVIQIAILCITQVKLLSDDGAPQLDLSGCIPHLEECRGDLEKLLEEIVNEKAYLEIEDCIRNRRGITELITRLLYCSGRKLLHDCHLKPADVTVLKDKNVLLFISNLYSSKDDWLVLQDLLNGRNGYEIVWFPIVAGKGRNQWNKDKILTISQKLKCYTVYNYESSIVGIKYIRKEWRFSYNPMVVVFNSDASIKCPDAMQMIRLWRWHAIPFEQDKPGKLLLQYPDCFSLFFSYKWMKQVEKESYILFYGGNEEWINTFKQRLNIQVRQSKVKISGFAIREKREQSDIDLEAGQFWSIIENFYYLKIQGGFMDTTTTEIQKLLFYKKHENGWAVLYRMGSHLVCGPGDSILEAVEISLKKPTPGKPFEIPRVKPSSKICCHIEIQSSSELLPMELKCPVCDAMFERIVTYKCCHKVLNST